MKLRIAGRQMVTTKTTLEALAQALGHNDPDSAAKWLRRGPTYYGQKATPTLDPFKAFRRRVVGSEAEEAGWRVVTADQLRDEEKWWKDEATKTKPSRNAANA